MNFSYWEIEGFFRDADIVIVGSGIVGLTAAVSIKQSHPNYNVVILEKGTLNDGASSRNAGFACFGSASELLDDLKTMSLSEVMALVKMRWEGLASLRNLLGDHQIAYDPCGGFELFREKDVELLQECKDGLEMLNEEVNQVIGVRPYSVNNGIHKEQGFAGISDNITNSAEGSIHTGKMIRSLIDLASSLGVMILNGIEVDSVYSTATGAELMVQNIAVKCKKAIICTNGFAKRFFPEFDIAPARNQVLVTSTIPGLRLNGTFHMHKGYVYFRNIDSRVLIGGFRHLSKDTEATTSQGTTDIIQDALKRALSEIILPSQKFDIEYSWSGIMGVGSSKSVILEEVQPNVVCGVRLGGMGVAIGALIGKRIATYID